MYRRYSAGNFFEESPNYKIPVTGARPIRIDTQNVGSNRSSQEDTSGSGGESSPSTGQGMSLSAYIRKSQDQLDELFEEAERQFDIWQDNMNLLGHGGGGTPSSGPTTTSTGGDGVSSSQALPRVTRELRSSASVPCDDDMQDEIQRDAQAALTALPVSVYASEQPSSDFVFDQYQDMLPIGVEDPERVQATTGWYSEGFVKHNRMIPSQYYYDSLVTTPYMIRDPNDQKDPEVNLGSMAISNVNLTDHLRYVLGCTWEAGSLRLGTPKTALMMSSDWEILDPAAQGFLDALARRGIFFCIQPSSDTGIIRENLEVFGPAQAAFDTDIPSAFGGFPPAGYTTILTIMTNMSILKKMQAANPQMIPQDFNVFDYLKGLTEREVILQNPGTSAQLESIKKVYEHTFRAPTGYPVEEAEKDRYDPLLILKDLVSIVPRNRTREQFYTKKYKNERLKKSIYRSFAESFRMEDVFADVNIGSRRPPTTDNDQVTNQGVSRPKRDDIIQKFTSSKVLKVQEINGFVTNGSDDSTNFTQVAGQDVRVPFDYWLNNNLENYNLISFKMNHNSDLALLMQRLSLDTLLFEMIDASYPFNETFFAQILDTVINLDSELNTQDLIDKSSINLRPNEIKEPIESLKRMLEPLGNTGVSEVRGMPFSISEIDNFSYPLGYDGLTINKEKDALGLNEFANKLRTSLRERDLIKGKIPEWSKINEGLSFQENFEALYKNFFEHRRASQIVGGVACHSEVLAYRIEKRDAVTKELVQQFLFFNTEEVEDFNFIDSQVLPGKKYIYRIFTINFVVGSEYSYQFEMARFRHDSMGLDPQLDGSFTEQTVRFDSEIGQKISPTFSEEEFLDPVPTQEDEPESLDYLNTLKIQIPLSVRPSYRIIEAPYYEQTVTAMTNDRPPIYPDVQVLDSYRTSKKNQSAVMIYPFSRFGFETAEPILMMESDRPTIADMLEVQQKNDNSPDASKVIQYRSDTEPERYEMFYMFEPPEDYSSFSKSGSRLSTSRDKRFFDLNLPHNVKVFVTFRTVDLAGFSNPGPIYCLTRHNYGDGTYTTFEPYEPKKRIPRITCNRLISIEPAIEQKVFNIEDEDGEINFETAPEDLQSITLGKSTDDSALIWGRKFKFRFVSTNSYNAFDVNCDFGFDKSLVGRTSQGVTPATESNSASRIDIARRQRRKQNEDNSNQRLNNPGTRGIGIDPDASINLDPADPQGLEVPIDITIDASDPQDYRGTVSDPYSSQFDTSLAPSEDTMSGAVIVRDVAVDTSELVTDVGPQPSTGGGGGATGQSTSGGGVGSADLEEEYLRRRRRRVREYQESQY